VPFLEPVFLWLLADVDAGGAARAAQLLEQLA